MRGKHNPAVPIAQPRRASNGFGSDEIALMAQLLEKLLQGGDASLLTRAPAFQVVAGKFARMRKQIETREGSSMNGKASEADETQHGCVADEPRPTRDAGHVMSGTCPCGHDHEMLDGRSRS